MTTKQLVEIKVESYTEHDPKHGSIVLIDRVTYDDGSVIQYEDRAVWSYPPVYVDEE